METNNGAVTAEMETLARDHHNLETVVLSLGSDTVTIPTVDLTPFPPSVSALEVDVAALREQVSTVISADEIAERAVGLLRDQSLPSGYPPGNMLVYAPGSGWPTDS